MQTAISWLQEQIFNSDWKNMSGEDKLKLFEQAKQMEKQQIIDAYCIGKYINVDDREFGEKFYNETYGSKGSDDTFKNDDSNDDSNDDTPLDFFYKRMIPFGFKLKQSDRDIIDHFYKQAKQLEKSTTSSQTEISVDEIEKAAKQFYEENIDCSNIPINHYEWEIQELMSDFCYKWYREQLKKKQ